MAAAAGKTGKGGKKGDEEAGGLNVGCLSESKWLRKKRGDSRERGGTGGEGRRHHGSAVLLPFLPSRGENQ